MMVRHHFGESQPFSWGFLVDTRPSFWFVLNENDSVVWGLPTIFWLFLNGGHYEPACSSIQTCVFNTQMRVYRDKIIADFIEFFPLLYKKKRKEENGARKASQAPVPGGPGERSPDGDKTGKGNLAPRVPVPSKHPPILRMFNHFRTRFPSKRGLFLSEPHSPSRASLLKDLAFPPVASPSEKGGRTPGSREKRGERCAGGRLAPAGERIIDRITEHT